MFEMMNKHRIWILGLLFVGLVGWGAWSAVQQLFGGSEFENPEVGRFTLPGAQEATVVTLEDYQRTGNSLERYFAGQGGITAAGRYLGLGDQDPESILWSYIVLREAARQSGVPVSEKQVESTYLMRAGRVPDGKPVYVPDGDRAFLRELFMTDVFKRTLSGDPAGTLFADAYDRFKREAEEIKGRVLVIESGDGAEFTLNFEDPADMNRLVEWYDANKYRFHEKRIKEQVDLEVVYVRMSGKDVPTFAAETEAWATSLSGFEATDEEALARWNAHRDAYSGLLKLEADRLKREQEEENQRAKDEGREPRNLTAQDQPSEYERLKDHLKREIRLGKLLASVIDEVKGGALMKEVAARHKLPIADLPKMDRDKLQTQPEVGNARAMQMIWGSAVQKLPPAGSFVLGSIVEYESTNAALFLPRIFDEPGQFLAVFRLIDHRKDRDAELKEIRDHVYKTWQEVQASEASSKKAKEIREEAVARAKELEEVKPKIADLDREYTEAVEKDIKEQSLDRANAEHKAGIEAIELRHDAARQAKVKELVKPHLGKVLTALASEKGLTLYEVPWTRKSNASGVVYADGLQREEKLNRFLRSPMVIYQLGNLEPGHATEAMDAEPQTRFACIGILDDKRQPGPGDLLAWPDKLQDLSPAGSGNSPPTDWTFATLQAKNWFGLDVPNLTKRREFEAKEKEINAVKDKISAREDAQRGFADVLRAMEEKRRAEKENPAPAPDAPKPPENPDPGK